ncbi:MAG: hypothetical protein LBR70_02335 [Lactobacillaceae bacterium]|jgi:hypothetical protein|nr:hypothetical protein [Lactobacillaceae bacterium]
MKKLIFIVLTMLAVCNISANAQTSVTYYYDEDYCWDIYERYIPSGYFSGPQGTKIHYYGDGDFFVGYPVGNGLYEWEVMHMDFRPLHRMVLSRDRFGLAAVHILLVNGHWVWSLSYDEYIYGGRTYPRVHYYGNHLSWHYCNSIPYAYSYFDWSYNYIQLTWRHNHRPSYYANFHNRRGDGRRYQYYGNSSYGHRNAPNGRPSRTYNSLNSDERRVSRESMDTGRDVLRREFETARRGYETGRSTSTSTRESGTTSHSRQSSYRSNRDQTSSTYRDNLGGSGRTSGRNDEATGSSYGRSSGSTSYSGSRDVDDNRSSTSVSREGTITRRTTSTTSTEVQSSSGQSSRSSSYQRNSGGNREVLRETGSRTSTGSGYSQGGRGSSESSVSRSSTSTSRQSSGVSSSQSGGSRSSAESSGRSSSSNNGSSRRR